MSSPINNPESPDNDEQEIVVCGRNNTGQLGLSNNIERNQLTRLEFPLGSRKILLLTAGTHHTLALTCDNRLYGWGWGNYGQLSTGTTLNYNYPKLINVPDEDSEIVCISAGYSHSSMVTKSGKCFTTGRNDLGQLGLGHHTGRLEFTQIKELSNITEVWNGCPITKEEKLWSWGSNEFGQLGLGDYQDRNYPCLVNIHDDLLSSVSSEDSDELSDIGITNKISTDYKVNLIRTGPFHCVVTMESSIDQLNPCIPLSWGRGDCGQTGQGDRSNSSKPTIMVDLLKLMDGSTIRLLAVRAHNIAVCSNGKIVVWGRNNHAQLGLAKETEIRSTQSNYEDQTEPKENLYLPNSGLSGSEIVDVSVGPFHTAAVLEDGKLWMWGWIDNSGIPYTSRTDDFHGLHTPFCISAIKDKPVVHIAAGYSHLVLVLAKPFSISPSTLTIEFGSCLNDPEFSDITLVVEDQKIHCHKVILATRSAFFKAMFLSGMIESHQTQIEIKGTSYQALYCMISYLYTDLFCEGKYDQEAIDLSLEVLPLAEKYVIPRLGELCQKVLIESSALQPENLLDIYELAVKLRASNLRRRCHWLITKKMSTISRLSSWNNLAPELAAQFPIVKNN